MENQKKFKKIIGFRVVGGDDNDVLEELYTSYATGTLGSHVRSFTPVYDSDGAFFLAKSIKKVPLGQEPEDIAKLSRTKELGIDMIVDNDTYLAKMRDEIMSNRMLTIIGNLLENAMDALNSKNSDDKTIHIMIREEDD